MNGRFGMMRMAVAASVVALGLVAPDGWQVQCWRRRTTGGTSLGCRSRRPAAAGRGRNHHRDRRVRPQRRCCQRRRAAQDNSPFKDFFDEFLKRQQGDNAKPRPMASMGSGFVIDATGLIVTNNHVVEGADTIEVHMQDDTILKAELVGRDPKTDLAVIRVKPDKPLPTVSFGDSDHLRIGEWVMAIGNPFGLGGSVSLGIVSARNRDINAGPYDDYIQTDAAINKGNSGGPLFNLKGEVVGINTAIFSPTGGSVGIGFSVPANTAKNVVDAAGEVWRDAARLAGCQDPGGDRRYRRIDESRPYRVARWLPM